MGILRILGIVGCKGLHCAGCGKGKPAGIVALIVLLLIAAHKQMAGLIGELLHFLEMAVIFVGIGLVAAGVVIALSLRAITMVRPVLGMKWDGKTQCEIKADHDEYYELVPQWPERGMLEMHNTQPIPVYSDEREKADTWT